ncbi:MAG: hypothetical protein PHH85_14050 [Candidatus Methanoperedens sp.]|nr:hypothetical protein [Candidatus Methanoperedens sp.]
MIGDRTLLKDKIRKKHIAAVLAASAVLILAAFAIGNGFFVGQPHAEKPKTPSVSIGCDRVVWDGTELEIIASTQNINKPMFNWTVDGKDAGTGQKLLGKFDKGEHRVMLTATFDNRMLTANQSTIVIDSGDGISIRDSSASKNQWGFQALYNGKKYGVKDVMVSVDSSQQSEVNECGFMSSKALMAGDHTWKAEYQGKTIASGKFNIKEVSEIKITGLDIASSYTAGSDVNAKIVLLNTGSTTVTGFEISTLAVNNNYAFMGDKAKKEFVDQYQTDLKPGVNYDIPIVFTIPEKVSGIRPSGKYTITVSVILNGQVVDKKIVNTMVK